MGDIPAMLLDHRDAVLAWNDLAHQLYAPHLPFEAPSYPTVRPNTGRLCFLHEPTRELYADWPAVAHDNVAYLRMAAARYPEDRVLAELIGELTMMKGPDFTAIWNQHPVQDCGRATRTFRHPKLGTMTLTEEVVVLSDNQSLRMLLASAEPGTSSHESLRLLGSIAATERQTRQHDSAPTATPRTAGSQPEPAPERTTPGATRRALLGSRQDVKSQRATERRTTSSGFDQLTRVRQRVAEVAVASRALRPTAQSGGKYGRPVGESTRHSLAVLSRAGME